MTKFRTGALIVAGVLSAMPVAAHAFRGGDPAEFAAIREEAFTEADVNGDDVLSVTEFAQFHDIVRSKMEAKHFAKIDADGSGGITLEELEAARPPRGGGPGGPQ